MKSQFNILKLVYSPISNQYAEWIKDEKEVAEQLKNSNLYMIVQRTEAKFHIYEDFDLAFNEQNSSLKAQLIVGDIIDDFEINLTKLFELHNIDLDEYDISIELGKKQIRFWKVDMNTREKIDVIDWFTTEKILWDKWKKHPAIIGLNKINLFSKFYLHYVGISKEEDSLTRLVVRPHDKRLRILSNENSIANNSRLTDELILLFFKIDDLKIQVWQDNDNFDFLEGKLIDKRTLIADAEKAFIKILNAKYNTQKYINYPKSRDGLYNKGLNGYAYCIGESLTLVTDTSEIKGDDCPFYTYENADSIIITGDKVELLKK